MNGIIIEGADGTGKTTLAKHLAAKYDIDICHCTAEDPADYDFYLQTSRKKNVIWDRHTIGELIYPTVFNRQPKISTEDARLLLAYAREYGASIFVLTADIQDIKWRLKERGNECAEVLEKIEWINERFLFFADQFHIPVINTSKDIDYQWLFDTIENTKGNPFEFIHK